jgi:hypothetical protein
MTMNMQCGCRVCPSFCMFALLFTGVRVHIGLDFLQKRREGDGLYKVYLLL